MIGGVDGTNRSPWPTGSRRVRSRGPICCGPTVGAGSGSWYLRSLTAHWGSGNPYVRCSPTPPSSGAGSTHRQRPCHSVTIRLTAVAGWPYVSAWVRYNSRERLGKDGWAGLNPLTGRQLAAVRASLPAPAARPLLVVPARALQRDDEQLDRIGGLGPPLTCERGLPTGWSWSVEPTRCGRPQ
jgi:hypothetical protein